MRSYDQKQEGADDMDEHTGLQWSTAVMKT